MPLSAEDLYKNINSTISLPQWQAWADKQSPDCPPERPFKTDKSVSGGDQNECVETPDNCPEGTRAFGKDKCLPENAREFGGDGRPGPGGPNAPGTRPGGGGYPGGPGGMYPYAGPEGVYGSEDIGGDYGLSSMYQGLLGNRAQSQAFLASQTEALQQQKEGQIQQIMATIPEGGQRDRAIAELEKGHQSTLGQLRQGLIGSALTGLQGLYGTQLSDATQRYGINTGADTARYGIDVGARTAGDQLGLGYAQLGQQGTQFDKNFGEGQRQFDIGQGNWGKEFDWQKEYANQQRQDKRRSGLSSMISGLAGGLLGGGNESDSGSGGGGSWWKKALGVGASVAPFLFSDERTKEDVEPFTSGLSEIIKLMPIEASYNGKAGTEKGERLVSVMAQDLEKVLPEAVREVETEDLPNAKMISPLTILMTSVNALKEVDKRLHKLEKKVKKGN